MCGVQLIETVNVFFLHCLYYWFHTDLWAIYIMDSRTTWIMLMFTTYKWSISSGLAAAADCCVSIECFDFFFPVFGIRLHGFFFSFL